MHLVSRPSVTSEQLVVFINHALHDPPHLYACWGCLAGCFSLLISPPFGEEFIFTKNCPIWPAILKFVTHPRSDEELASLVLRHSQCSSSCSGSEWLLVRHTAQLVLHGWYEMWKTEEPAVASSPFHCFFSRIFKRLTPYLHDLSPTAVAKRRMQAWPFAPQDCIPHGAETTVKSLHSWIHLYRDPEPFALSLLGVVGHVGRSLVVSHIAASPNLASDIAKIGHDICDLTTRRMKDPASLTAERRIEIGDAFHRRMWHIEKFWKCVLGESNMQSGDIERLCGGLERSLFDMFSKALGHLHTPNFFCEAVRVDLLPYTIQVITDAAATMYMSGRLLLEIPPTPQHMRPDILAYVLKLGKEWGHDPFAKSFAIPAYTILKSSKEREVCFSLGCHRSIQMLEPGAAPESRFRRCSGCQLVSYCGKECQVKAWRDPAIPHREICATIKEVIRQGGGAVDTMDKWRAREKKVDNESAKKVVEWFRKWETMQASKFIDD
ncbi:hypothetical protein R3P38DRAFT_3057927 [Favolaschia claudopus]|uniref:MYND-type domain-containing protein n=1 Tax=Favolaschia claudopus TaxID=2862362 RepID=A0AAW0A2U4_9AGAR